MRFVAWSVLILSLVGCVPPAVESARGFRCVASSECEGLPCNFGVCGGASPVQSLDAGRPSEASVMPAPATLTPSTLKEAAAGVRLTGLDLEGPLTITGANVEITDCRIRKGVVVKPGLENVKLLRVWVGPLEGVAISGSPSSVLSCRLEASVGIAGAIDSHIEATLWRPPSAGTGSFVDVQGGTRTLIAFNVCESKGGSCVTGAPAGDSLRDVLVLGNWFDGSGELAVDLAASAGVSPANVRVLNNRVARTFVATPGPIRVKGAARVENNVWSDGAPISP